MKHLLFPILLLPLWAFGQSDKTITPVAPVAATSATGIIRAVVVGISDYEDPNIHDLRFAHRDAEIFAEYLRSPAGGGVPSDKIKLLTNKQATLSAIDDALDWLRDSSEAGDLAIIYFSGHGDVEKQTPWQLGYLLTYNTWGNNYRNRAERIEDLNDIVISLSTIKNAKVIIVLDACRSGKLASQANRGATLTAEQMGKRVANEVRIMSCQPDQVSLEDPSFGGGRGLFSFYFVNGLKGLADEEKDQQVTLVEMEDYLKSKVRKAAKERNPDIQQNPVIEGQPSFTLALVQEPSLKIAEEEMSAFSASGTAVASADKGIKGSSEADTLAIQNDPMGAFSIALDKLNLMEKPGFQQAMVGNREQILQFFTTHLSADSAAHLLSPGEMEGLQKFLAMAQGSKSDVNLREVYSHQIAIQLNDRAQHTINLYLQGDAGELAKRYFTQQAKLYALSPLYIKAAMQLVEPNHPLYRRLQLNYLYLDGVGERLLASLSENPKKGMQKALKKQQKALEFDDKAPYIHNELGLLYLEIEEYNKAATEFRTAADLAPGWSFPPSNLSIVYTKEGALNLAIESAEKAISLQPDYPGGYYNLGEAWEKKRHYLRAETLYRKAIALNEQHFVPYLRMGYLLSATTRYWEAEKMFKTAEALKKETLQQLPTYGNYFRSPENLSPDREGMSYKFFSTPIDSPSTIEDFLNNGLAYLSLRQYQEAEQNFRIVIAMNPQHPEVYQYLGQLTHEQNRYEEAELCFLKLLSLRPSEDMLRFHLADVYSAQQRWTEAEKIYRYLLATYPDSQELRQDAYLGLLPILDQESRYLEEENILWEMIRFEQSHQTLKRLDSFYGRMIKQFPKDVDWRYKNAIFWMEIKRDEFRAMSDFQAILDIDTSYLARASLHARIGEHYLRFNKERALDHLRKSLDALPGQASTAYSLVSAYLHLNRYEEALGVLDSLYKNNQINLPNRLKLANLKALSGDYAAADSLFRKAEAIRIDTVLGLYEGMGKSALLNQKPEEALLLYQKEFVLQPQNPALAYTIARLYAKTKHPAEALVWLDRTFNLGFRRPLILKYEADWNPLRERAEWKEMMKKYFPKEE